METIQFGFCHKRQRKVRWGAVALAVAVALTLVLAPVQAYAATPATFTIGETSHIGTFHTTNYKFTTNEIYYEVEKNISFTVPQAPGEGKGQYVRVVLERLDGDSWFPYTDTTSYIINTKQTANLTYRIKQDTAGVKKYRFHVAANEVLDMADTVSPEFTVTGELQDPGLAVGYSKSSQRYKKTPVTVTVKMAQAYAGKATVYDGKKKLKTLTIKNGKTVEYTLSKKLKRGNHKITVKFAPGEEFTSFYKTVTSKAKTIKVKK